MVVPPVLGAVGAVGRRTVAATSGRAGVSGVVVRLVRRRRHTFLRRSRAAPLSRVRAHVQAAALSAMAPSRSAAPVVLACRRAALAARAVWGRLAVRAARAARATAAVRVCARPGVAVVLGCFAVVALRVRGLRAPGAPAAGAARRRPPALVVWRPGRVRSRPLRDPLPRPRLRSADFDRPPPSDVDPLRRPLPAPLRPPVALRRPPLLPAPPRHGRPLRPRTRAGVGAPPVRAATLRRTVARRRSTATAAPAATTTPVAAAAAGPPAE